MRFALSDSHREIRDTARRFGEREIAPFAREWSRTETFPKAAVQKAAELGFLGIRVPHRYGGAGLDTLAYSLIIEELARVDGSFALTIASHNGLATSHLMEFGSEEQKQKYLPKLASGEILGAWALTEPGSGSDAASLKTRAVPCGEGWVLNGTKMFITQGSVGGLYVVLAATQPELRQRGITAFLVEAGTQGLKVSRKLEKLGCASSDTAELTFTDLERGREHMIGKLDEGFIDTLRILDRGRISIASMALGLGEGALGVAMAHAQERVQFERPISEFQAIQWLIADSRTELDAARMLTWRAAWLADRRPRASREASMAKLYASEAASRACSRALQVLGAQGYARESPVERHLRDTKLCEIGEGTSEVQRIVIAREILTSG